MLRKIISSMLAVAILTVIIGCEEPNTYDSKKEYKQENRQVDQRTVPD